MKELFISTFNEKITIGLLDNNQIIKKMEKESLKSHSIYLIPMIKELLNNCDTKLSEVEQILVVNGPGSFTGIRLGITVAKTLAYTLNIPIKTISSIEAIACSLNIPNKIVMISDNKGEYIGIFENDILAENMIYLKENEVNQYIQKYGYEVYRNSDLNLEKISLYCKTKNPTPAHAANPIYIKGIEALNGK